MRVLFKVRCKEYFMSFLSMLSNRLREKEREREREKDQAQCCLSWISQKRTDDRQTDWVCVEDNTRERENQMKLIRPLPLKRQREILFSRSRLEEEEEEEENRLTQMIEEKLLLLLLLLLLMMMKIMVHH